MWTFADGKACYIGASGQALAQAGLFDIGTEYLISIEVSGRTEGQLRLDTFGGEFMIENGVYQFSGVATIPDLQIVALDYGGSSFDGCVEFVYAVEVPEVTIINSCTGTIDYTVPISEMALYKSSVQVNLPWDLAYGEYYVNVDISGINYQSPCFVVGDHTCTLLLSWTNDDNAYSIDYETLEQQNNLRVEAKLWHVQPRSDKREIFEFSDGSAKILYAKKSMVEKLTLKRLPDYLVRALGIGIDHDSFKLEGTEYIVLDGDLDMQWRKSSDTAPAELEIKKKNSNLINKNCR